MMTQLDWSRLTEDQCWKELYQIGGALRRLGNHDLAQRVEKVANKLYPGDIKPAPIVPRTMSG